jgi:pimeloyl-ACP methyl ester carboxylesterase
VRRPRFATALDEVGSERAALLVSLDAGSMVLYFAATKPERTSALILFNTSAKFIAADDYPFGIPRESAEALLDRLDQLWGKEAMAQLMVPSRAADERFRRWYASSCAAPPARGPLRPSCASCSRSTRARFSR